MKRKEELMKQEQEKATSLMREIDVLRMLFRQTSSSNNNKNAEEDEKRKQRQHELLQTLRRETEKMKSFVRSIETDVSSSRTRTLILQDEMEKINVRKLEAEKRSQKRLEGIRTETKLAELTLSTLPTSTWCSSVEFEIITFSLLSRQCQFYHSYHSFISQENHSNKHVLEQQHSKHVLENYEN